MRLAGDVFTEPASAECARADAVCPSLPAATVRTNDRIQVLPNRAATVDVIRALHAIAKDHFHAPFSDGVYGDGVAAAAALLYTKALRAAVPFSRAHLRRAPCLTRRRSCAPRTLPG